MATSIHRIDLAMVGLLKRKRAELGIAEDEPPPDKAEVAKSLKSTLRAHGATKKAKHGRK